MEQNFHGCLYPSAKKLLFRNCGQNSQLGACILKIGNNNWPSTSYHYSRIGTRDLWTGLNPNIVLGS
jgi:hypothetical protein